MRELTTSSPIGTDAAGKPAVFIAPDFRMSERALSILSIRVPHAPNAGDIGARLGIALPSLPNAALKLDDGWIVCTEPNAWRMISAPLAHRDAIAALADVTADRALVSDLGSAFCVIEVFGAGARRAIASGCPLDLHERVFKIGSVASSCLIDIPVLILKNSEEPGFLVVCERSRALTMWDWLAEAVSCCDDPNGA